MAFIRKFLCLACLLGLLYCSGNAQTFGEFFNQTKTQKRYLLQQIAALQVYAGYLEKGYSIASSGISAVRDFSKGEFNLHSAFFGSLKAVSPVIRNHSQVVDILQMELEIPGIFSRLKESEFLTTDNLAYISRVKAGILQQCGADLQELLSLITSGALEMSDNERLDRLGNLYQSMQEKYNFTLSFQQQVSVLILQKQNQQQSIQYLLKTYENHEP